MADETKPLTDEEFDDHLRALLKAWQGTEHEDDVMRLLATVDHLRARLDEVTRERDEARSSLGRTAVDAVIKADIARTERDAAIARAEEAEAHHADAVVKMAEEHRRHMAAADRAEQAEATLARVREAAEGKVVPDTSAPWFDPETDDPAPYVCDCGTCDRCAPHPTLDEVRAALDAAPATDERRYDLMVPEALVGDGNTNYPHPRTTPTDAVVMTEAELRALVVEAAGYAIGEWGATWPRHSAEHVRVRAEKTADRILAARKAGT